MTERPLMVTLGTQAKVVAAKGVATSNIVAQLTELAAVFVSGWLLSIGKLDQDNFMYIIGACIIGPAIAHMRGKEPLSSMATILALLPWVAQKNLLG